MATQKFDTKRVVLAQLEYSPKAGVDEWLVNLAVEGDGFVPPPYVTQVGFNMWPVYRVLSGHESVAAFAEAQKRLGKDFDNMLVIVVDATAVHLLEAEQLGKHGLVPAKVEEVAKPVPAPAEPVKKAAKPVKMAGTDPNGDGRMLLMMFDHVRGGCEAAKIHKVREGFGKKWSKQRFDDALAQLRKDYVIDLHLGDPGSMTRKEVADSFIDVYGVLYISMTQPQR